MATIFLLKSLWESYHVAILREWVCIQKTIGILVWLTFETYNIVDEIDANRMLNYGKPAS